jgi:hypothetical protein
MSESGEVDREVVIAVLRAKGVDVHGQADGPPDMLVLAKGDRVEGQRFPKMVGRKMLHYLCRHYPVYIHEFYNPKIGASDIPA